MRVAVVGAGWAGMAATVALTQAGHHVTVMEAARTLGGRARALHTVDAAGQPLVLDNGQHILIGAYTGKPPFDAHGGRGRAQRHAAPPLTLTYADRSGLELPDLPSPGMRWWAWRGHAAGLDKQSRVAAHLRQLAVQGFRCDARWSVAQLCERLPQRLLREFIEPLCVSALNTPRTRPARKCSCACCATACSAGAVARTCCCPRTDLGALFPDTAAQWLQARGGAALGQRVAGLARTADGWDVDGTL